MSNLSFLFLFFRLQLVAAGLTAAAPISVEVLKFISLINCMGIKIVEVWGV